MAIEFNQETLNESIEQNKPILIDFWAEWCGPCRIVGPVIEQVANEYEGKAIVGKVNVDENEDLAAEYRVRSIPTVLFIKDGKVVDTLVGAKPKSEYTERLEKLI